MPTIDWTQQASYTDPRPATLMPTQLPLADAMQELIQLPDDVAFRAYLDVAQPIDLGDGQGARLHFSGDDLAALCARWRADGGE